MKQILQSGESLSRLVRNNASSAVCFVLSLVAIVVTLTFVLQRDATALPGNVPNPSLWLRADQALQVNGSGQVTSWSDQSGSGLILTQAQSSHPTHSDTIAASSDILKVDSGVNFNPAVDFSGAHGKSLKGLASESWNSSANLNIFAVASPEGISAGAGVAGIFSTNGSWTGSISGRGLLVPRTPSSYLFDGSGCSPLATTSSTTGPHIARVNYIASANSLNGLGFLDGKHERTGTNCNSGVGGPNFEIGGRTTDNAYDNRIFNGKIAEVLVFKSALTTTEAQKIDSYLAIKYGITLQQSPALDYLASNNTVVWDATTNTAYSNRITGIGRDDASPLYQKQSRSVHPGSLVTIANGNTITADNASNTSTLTNGSFMTFGDNNGAVNAWTNTGVPALDAQDYQRIDRQWKVQETGSVGPITLSFNVDDPASDIVSPVDNYYLLNLTTGTAVPMTNSDGGSNYSVSGVDFASGDVFTIGTFNLQRDVHFRKTVNPVATSITPGQTFTYTITVENRGNATQSDLSFVDDLSEVIDDATYNSDVDASVGSAAYDSSTNEIEWSGVLGVDQTATITYSATMNNPTTGDGRLNNGIVASGEGVNCTADPAVDPDCMTVTPLPNITAIKSLVSPSSPQAGDEVEYEFTITNEGAAAASGISIADNLTGVLDDAEYVDASAPSGNVSFDTNSLRVIWNGNLAASGSAGDSVTVSVTVQVNTADNLGDGDLNNALVSSNCPNPAVFDPSDPDYVAGCAVSTPVRAWVARKTVSAPARVTSGADLTYTVEVENTGGTDLTGVDAPTVTDDLTNVLDDATYNNDANASAGTVTYSNPELIWTGDLNEGDTVTFTYGATVNSADDLGNRRAVNTIAGSMNCPSTPATDPDEPGYSASCVTRTAITVPPTNPGNNPSDPDSPNAPGAPDAGVGQGVTTGWIALIVVAGLTVTGLLFGKRFLKR